MVAAVVVAVVEAASLVQGSARAPRSSMELWRGYQAPWRLRGTHLREQHQREQGTTGAMAHIQTGQRARCRSM